MLKLILINNKIVDYNLSDYFQNIITSVDASLNSFRSYFHCKNFYQLLRKIEEPILLSDIYKNKCSSSIQDLLYKLLNKDPKLRDELVSDCLENIMNIIQSTFDYIGVVESRGFLIGSILAHLLDIFLNLNNHYVWEL